MTRRERLEAKANRLRGWAEKRETRATAQLNSHPEIRHDWAFITQPGHIPFRARMNAADDRACESLDKAAGMRGRAVGIDQALDRSIFSDDPDAVEALRARIAELEAERDAAKRVSGAWRKAGKPKSNDREGWGLVATYLGGVPLETLDKARANCASEERFLGRGPVPNYVLTNLGGNILRLKKRIVEIERREAKTAQAEAAGGCLITYPSHPDIAGKYAVVTFAEKPDRGILDALRAAGYQWGGGSWSGQADRLPESVKALAAPEEA